MTVRSRLPGGALRRLLLAWLLVAIGGWAYTVAIAVYAFRVSGAGAVGVFTAVRLLPAVLAAPLIGGVIDRANRARVAAVTGGIQAVCVSAAAALVLGRGPLTPVFVLAAASRTAATGPRPALQTLMPSLARAPEELTRATAIWSAIDNFGFLVGGGIGGVAVAAAGSGGKVAAAAGGSGVVIAAAAVLFALGAALAASLPSVTAAAPDPAAGDADGFAAVLAGLRAVAQTPMLRAPFALFAGALLLEGTSDVQLAALSLGKLGMGNGGLGLLYVFWGAGGVLSGALILRLVRRRGYGLALGVGAFAFAAGLAFCSVDGIPVALVAMILAGVGFALLETAIMALVPRLADDAIIGRVYALSEILYAGAGGLGALLAVELIKVFGIAGSLMAVGGVFAVGSAFAWRSYQRLDAGQNATARVRELLHGIRFLKPLPLPQLERLVRGASPLTVPVGASVVRRGEPGDRFYVIEAGTVEIVEYGVGLGPGQGFGEIALLRDVPRSATVRASTDLRLWALHRQAFVAAVSGHRDATQLADAIVTDRLTRARIG